MNEDLLLAARARAEGMAQRSHRPRERRQCETPGSSARASYAATMSLRAAVEVAADGWTFVGQATVYEHGYEMWDWYGPYTEIVSAGAGEKSLQTPGLDVPLVLAHDSLRRIARTTNGSLTLTESDAGLDVLAPDLDPTDVDVAYIAPKIRSGLIDEMSFMFRIIRGEWSPDYMQYRINEYDVHRGDVAIVGYGANPATSSDLRAAAHDLARMRSLLDLELAGR